MRIFQVFFFIFYFCLSPLIKAQDHVDTVYVVFDMNGVTMNGYRPTPDFGVLLSALDADPRYKIIFFSTQTRSSILNQLKEIRLINGKTADMIAEVFDGSHMTDLDDQNQRNQNRTSRSNLDFRHEFGPLFGGRYKDLRALVGPNDLPNTILVDDTFSKAHPNQIANLLWLRSDIGFADLSVNNDETQLPNLSQNQGARALGYIMNFFKKFNSKDSGLQLTEIRSMPPEFRQNYRSAFIMGVLDMIRLISNQRKISISAALSILQWGDVIQSTERSQEFYFNDADLVKSLINKGLKNFSLYSQMPQDECRKFLDRSN